MSNDRHTEEGFRRYEPFLVQWQGTFPNKLEIDPTPYSMETVACRLRDAAKAYFSNNWWSGLDRAKFANIWAQTKVVRDIPRGMVILRAKMLSFEGREIAAVKKPGFDENGQEIMTITKSLEIMAPTDLAIRAILVLHDEGHITMPSKLTKLTELQMAYLQQQKDDTTKEFFNVGISVLTEDSCVVT